MKTNNSILIGKYIYQFLTESDELQSYLNGKVYPLIVDEDITYPFVVYSRQDVVPSYNKDGNYQDNISITIHIVSDNYVETLEIANIIRHIFELKRYADDKIAITQFLLDNVSESFEEDAYIQTLNISAICGTI